VKAGHPNGGTVKVHLARVLASPTFIRSPRQSAFLRYVVEKRLSGQDDELKESLIGVHVFGKRPDYDPKNDSSVRSEAAKLRTKLEQYYREDGKDDPVVILIKKGAYVPEFTYRPGKRLNFVLITVAVIAIASMIALAVIFSSLRTAPTQPFYSAVPLTTYAGSEICPSFSPDGERVAFAWDGEKQDNFDIYVKQSGVAEPLRLTTDPGPELSPAWSPDGRTIAFLRVFSVTKASLLLMPSLDSGPVRQLAEVAAPTWTYEGLKSLAWSPDGNWLAVSDGSSPNSPKCLYLISVHTGEKRRLTLPPAAYDDFDPAFSPDMRRLVFVRYSGRWAGDLHLLSLSKDLSPLGDPKRLTFHNRRIGTPVWTRDGRALLFARYEFAGAHSLWRMILSDPPKVAPLPIPADNSATLALSAKGNRLVYTRDTSQSNIWGIEIPSSPRSVDLKRTPRPWISSSAEQENPQFSPDGRRIAFQSNRSGYLEIWVADRDGSHPRQLTEMRAAITGFPRWSPEGNRIVFHSRQKSSARLFVVDVRGGHPEPLTDGLNTDYSPSWSHDGQWIYFASRRSEAMQVWKMPAKGGRAMQVTRHGGWTPLESADGRYLFYGKGEPGLWRLPLAGGEEQRMLTDVAASGAAYAVRKQGIYFIGRNNHSGGQGLAFLSFATGRITPLATVARPVTWGLAVSPDERLILYSQVDNAGSDLMLVENFR
jgi:Tol biopolymer transport system component